MKMITLFLLAAVIPTGQLAGQEVSREEARVSVGEIELRGTLTLPATTGPHPGVVLISGGAADNRDAQVGEFRPFRLLADHLAEQGIASLRFDDRGVGESGGEHFWQYTLPDLVLDVDAWIAQLKQRPDVDATHIGLIGHSYGGTIARHAAVGNPDVAYLVLMASYARSWGDSLSIAARAFGQTQEERAQWTAFELRVVNEAVRGNQSWQTVEVWLRERASREFHGLSAEKRTRFDDFEHFYNTTPYAFLMSYCRTPWYAYLIEDDLREVMPKIGVPVLLLFGKSDGWVPPASNRNEMVLSFAEGGNRNVSVIEVPMADHYLRTDPTANEFGSKVLESISSWISEIVGRR